ncbi:hypothetical protein [Streptomyces sp. NPDC020742]|uniref:hypothetical protein n=1 Tax=Streptomyces sp. NPDC020742 TaxID=3154897 RepID=UPI00341116F3
MTAGSAADRGGYAPVPGGGSLPCDGDGELDDQDAGEDGGGTFGGALEQFG